MSAGSSYCASISCRVSSTLANDVDSEKHSRKEEAKAKLNEGVSFNKVAEEFSEDKAKQGTLLLCAYFGRLRTDLGV